MTWADSDRNGERYIPLWIRQGLMRLADGMCGYCGVRSAEVIDHIIPVSRGGTADPSNLLPSCERCNATKSDRTPQEWFSDIGEDYTYALHHRFDHGELPDFRPPPKPTAAEVLVGRLDEISHRYQPDECWPWPAEWHETLMPARAMWQHVHGPISGPLVSQVRRTCGGTGHGQWGLNCVNPAHLELRNRSKSRFVGLHWDGRRWNVWLATEGGSVHVGKFVDEVAAAIEYDNAAEVHLGERPNERLGLLTEDDLTDEPPEQVRNTA